MVVVRRGVFTAAAMLVAGLIFGVGGGGLASGETNDPNPQPTAAEAGSNFASDYVGDAPRGRLLFNQCVACHEVGPKARHRTGPHLTNVVGRTAGSAEGFAYGLPLTMLGLRGMVWTEESLDAYLRRPEDLVEGTLMPHVGLASPQARADLIAYLRDPKAGGRPGLALHQAP